MAELNDDNIKYTNIKQADINTGYRISVAPYETNGNQLTKYPDPLINAIDIDWGGASVNNQSINTTGDLLKLIGSKSSGNPIDDIDNESVIGIMLSAIRALQAEVIKLRNSLVYGVYSYTGKQTAMSEVIDNYGLEDINAKEPLWAVDETNLSELIYVDLTSANNFDRTETISIDIENSALTFTDKSTWRDSQNLISNNTDPKLLVYLTTTGLKVTFNLIDIENNENTLSIKLNELVNSNENNLYNILFILATSTEYKKNNNTILAGDNFCWIQVGHFIYDGIQQGYYNKDYYDENTGIKGKLQDDEITFGNTRYILDSIDFEDLTLSKFNIYSKYQDFSNEVEAINPNENDRYRVAHITIRSIDTYDDLVEIKDELAENELIYVETGNTLYIKNGYKLKKLGVGGQNGGNTPGDDDNPQDIETMTNKELLTALKNMGIVYEHYSENPDSHDYDLELAALDSVTFINQATGKKFDISVDAYGQLKSVEQDSIQTIADKIGENVLNQLMNNSSVRGFVANVNAANDSKIDAGGTTDLKLNADRIKIGAIYAPLDTETTFGCSHAYVELENTSDKDFPLNNCYLHYCKWNSQTSSYNVYHLLLDGYIPAGGTYLVRGKKYVYTNNDANVFINVDTYDKEWYVNGELIDFTMNDERTTPAHAWSFALTYENSNILETTPLYESATDSNTPSGETKDTNVYVAGFIDAISINNTSGCKWAKAAFTQTINCIYKNTFELDPAKQAFNGLHSKDSSRVRWANVKTDFQYVLLNKNVIEFPKTDEVKYVKDYTPKASFEHKNVCTDKTQFDIEKPNMPTVSFGMDAFKTRCFNWLSGGNFNEYVFIKNPDAETWDNGNTWKVFESYKQRNLTHIKTTHEELTYNELDETLSAQLADVPSNAKITYTTKNGITTATFTWSDSNQVDYTVTITSDLKFKYKNEKWMSYTSIIIIDEDYYKDTEYIAYQSNTSFPVRKEYNYDICNIGYCGYNYKNHELIEGKRVSNVFPASNIYYTSHKCVIDILSDTEINNLTEPKTYTYVVGRADKTGKAPDFEHCSKEMHFTMYPKSYTPRVYQITDQQGFHWIEYQAWAAAAIKLNEVINKDCQHENIIPVLINTGDMTQSGARINEWLDYYNAGECLFDHLEQMNVVGNNDLCGTDVTALGTGDDPGKSNGYFYYICYCYEVNNFFNDDAYGKTTNDWKIEPVAGEHYTQEEITEAQEGDDAYGKTTNDWKIEPVAGEHYTQEEINNAKQHYPIVNDTIIPSLYYFDFACTNQTYRMCIVNSEITLVNCKEWFNLGYGNDYTANIYTGFTVKSKYNEDDYQIDSNSAPEQKYVANDLEYTPIYTMLYYMLNCQKTNDTIKYLVFCHEMPFTVITHTNITINKFSSPRSVNGNNNNGSSMVGSKLNHIVWWENANRGYPKGLYWFSRLLEYKGIKLCIGGHKHTYCVTYPLREYYQYTVTENNQTVTKNSLENGPMTMLTSLENDTANFVWKETLTWNSSTIIDNKDVDHTKLPLTYRDNVDITNDKQRLYPYKWTNDDYSNHAVIYFMCQATGYKLTSNKELPTKLQKFTRVLPQTNNIDEKPNANQQYPMFAIYELNNENIKIKLGRIHEILNDSDHTFTQLSYGKNPMYISYMKRDDATNDYGLWKTEAILDNESKDYYIFNTPINW